MLVESEDEGSDVLRAEGRGDGRLRLTRHPHAQRVLRGAAHARGGVARGLHRLAEGATVLVPQRERDAIAIERVAEMKAQMNKVLFETKGTLGKPEWAIKRDEERARKRAEAAAAKAE